MVVQKLNPSLRNTNLMQGILETLKITLGLKNVFIPVAQIFSRNFYIFLSRFISLKIDTLQSAVNMAMFGNANIMLCVNLIIFNIIMLNLSVEFFSFMYKMGCYVLNILLSFPSRTVFLQCCLVRYSALFVCSGTIPHQTTLQENSSPRSRQ